MRVDELVAANYVSASTRPSKIIATPIHQLRDSLSYLPCSNITIKSSQKENREKARS